jgi:hypothetical protein
MVLISLFTSRLHNEKEILYFHSQTFYLPENAAEKLQSECTFCLSRQAKTKKVISYHQDDVISVGQ